MPRRTSRKRKASSSAGHGQGASKQQGGRRKSAPTPVRQTSPLATVLTPDTLGRSLSFLDVSSLVRSEMTATFVKDAAVGVWTALDKKIGADEKAEGDSARDRVIRSSPKYRHHLLAEYAAKVEMMAPSRTETIQHRLGSQLSEELDFYIRFARVDSKSELAEYEGSRRKGQTTFLAGGVFKTLPWKEFDDEDNWPEIGFDLTGCDLSYWPLLHNLLHPKECSFRHRVMFDGNNLCIERREALKGVTPTIVAINRKTLALSIVLASDSHYCIDGMEIGENGDEGHSHTQGTMTPYFWENEDAEDGYYEARLGNFLFYEDKWHFSLSEGL